MHRNTDQESIGKPRPEVVGVQAARGEVDAVRPGGKRHIGSAVDQNTTWSRAGQSHDFSGEQKELLITEVLLPYLDEIDPPADQVANPRPEVLRAQLVPVGHIVIEWPPNGKRGSPGLS